MKIGETGTKINWYWVQPDQVILSDNEITQEQMKWCEETFGTDNWLVDITRWYFKSPDDRTMFIITWS